MRKLFKTSLTAILCFVFGVSSAASLNYVFATENAPKEAPPKAKVVPTFDAIALKKPATYTNVDSGWIDVTGWIKNSAHPYINISKENAGLHTYGRIVSSKARPSSGSPTYQEGIFNITLDEITKKNDYGYFIESTLNNTDDTDNDLYFDAFGSFQTSDFTKTKNSSSFFGLNRISDKYNSQNYSEVQSQLSIFTKRDYHLDGKISAGVKAINQGYSPTSEPNLYVYGIDFGLLAFRGYDSTLNVNLEGVGVRGHGTNYGVLGTSAFNGGYGVAGFLSNFSSHSMLEKTSENTWASYPVSGKITSGAGISAGIYSRDTKKNETPTSFENLTFLGAIRQVSDSADPIYYGIYTDSNAYIKILKTLDIQSTANTDLSVFGLNNLNLKSGNDVIIAAGKNNILKGAKTVIDSKSGLQVIQGDVEINNVSNISANAKKIALNASESGITINSDKGPISIKSSDDKTILEIKNGQIHIKDIYVYDKLYCVSGGTDCLPKDTDPKVDKEKPRKFLLWIKEKLSAPNKIARSSDPKVINGERSVLSNLENISISFQKPTKVGIYDYSEFKLRGTNPCTGNGLDRFNADRVFDVLNKKDDKTCEARNRGNFQFQAHGESTRAGARAIYGNVFELKNGVRTPIKDVTIDCISLSGKTDSNGFFRINLTDNQTGNLTCEIKKISDPTFEPSEPIEVNIDNVDDVVHMDYYVNPKEIYY